MAKEKKVKTRWYKRWWAITLFIIVVVIILSNIFSDNSGQKQLKEKYDVLDYFCTDGWGSVEMKSLGNREDQVKDGLFYLNKDCQDPAKYSITILEPTKKCFYSFNGEIVRLYYNNTVQDNHFIPEESKRIIESDDQFSFWKIFAKSAYEFEMKNGISKMTDYESLLASGYMDYLKNGLTESTLYYIIEYQIGNSNSCE